MSGRMFRGWWFWFCALVGTAALVVTGCRSDAPRRDDGPGCGSCGGCGS